MTVSNMRWLRRLVLVAAVINVPTLHGKQNAPAQLTRFTFTEYQMGIDARIEVYAPDRETAENAVRPAFERIAQLEDIMSDYRPTSELMRLCAAPVGRPVPISPELFRVLERAQQVSARSDGAFDVTIGPLVQLWRKARREGKLPEAAALAEAKSRVDYHNLRLDRHRRTATLALANMRLDLGGIAKGYAGDEAIRVIRKHGLSRAMIEMGGDLVFGDAPPSSRGWQVMVPNASSAGVPKEMFLRNCALSSSGDTEQFVVIDGVRYSHVVDPKTGYGLSHRTQASVLARDGFTTDPLSTALTVLEEPKRAGFIRRYARVQVFVRTAR